MIHDVLFDTTVHKRLLLSRLKEQPKNMYHKGRKERNVLFNDTLNTFFNGFMASDIW